MSWSRRRMLAGLSTLPSLACSRLRAERHPPAVPPGVQVSLPVVHRSDPEGGPRLYLVEDHALPLVSLAIAIEQDTAPSPRRSRASPG